MLRGEPQEQAIKGYDARARKKEAGAARLKAATDAEANAGRGMCLSRPGSRGEVIANLAAMREALGALMGFCNHFSVLQCVKDFDIVKALNQCSRLKQDLSGKPFFVLPFRKF
jgi:hypothetical protein